MSYPLHVGGALPGDGGNQASTPEGKRAGFRRPPLLDAPPRKGSLSGFNRPGRPVRPGDPLRHRNGDELS